MKTIIPRDAATEMSKAAKALEINKAITDMANAIHASASAGRTWAETDIVNDEFVVRQLRIKLIANGYDVSVTSREDKVYGILTTYTVRAEW